MWFMCMRYLNLIICHGTDVMILQSNLILTDIECRSHSHMFRIFNIKSQVIVARIRGNRTIVLLPFVLSFVCKPRFCFLMNCVVWRWCYAVFKILRHIFQVFFFFNFKLKRVVFASRFCFYEQNWEQKTWTCCWWHSTRLDIIIILVYQQFWKL